jgi:nitrogen PTS system EIIA component
MQLDVRDAAAVLNVHESTVYRWIHERNLPATGLGGQYRFGRAELLEWATSHNIHVSPEAFAASAVKDQTLSMSEALQAGNIFHNVEGSDMPSVLRAVVNRLPLPESCDRDMIWQLFVAREATATTNVYRGIRIPHSRNPVIVGVTKPLLSLCFLASPVDFGSSDGVPVHALFVLLSTTIPLHLQLLARVACLLRDGACLRALERHAPAQEILSEVRRVEMSFSRPVPRAVAS